ncbi:uncharacterized protein LOC121731154 [Aricia agestis]|uniref:uncharacterized protein LOC121731154 n=1 Tax=Aricia agestis TaxID=91739 RepID=UPI001C20B78F|nr:uncharacterized protein LOC121731154 [Aricia agestis]
MAKDEEIKELVKKRGSYKGQLTNFINYCLELGKKETLLSTDAKELQLRIGKLESLYDKYDEVQLQLECLVDDVQAQYTVRAEFESQYYQALASAQDILSNYNKDTADADVSYRSISASARHQLVKLPTIQLPKFNGTYDCWLEFRDTFTSLIHSNNDIDEINKFHYLRASLEGSASVVIQSIDFSATNYSVAWKLLCERYDNKHLLIQNHISALFNIDNITKESSTVLKRLIDLLNKNIRALESLGEPVKQWDTLLIFIVTQKLDNKTYREWEQYKGRIDKKVAVTFDKFIDFIRNRADLIETLELSRNNHSTTGRQGSKFKSMVSVQNNTHSESVNKVCCPNCKGDHSLSNCSNFLGLSNEARLKLLAGYKVCYNCFHPGHFANRCKKQGCKFCKRRHNTLVHLDDFKGSNTHNERGHLPVSVSSSSAAQPPTKSSGSNDKNLTLSVKLSPSCDVKQHDDVLLSTALIKLFDANNREHIVRAVLDSGSTSCLITQRLSQKLNLKTCQINKNVLGVNNVSSHIRSNDFDDAVNIRLKVTKELASAGMTLRKWKSNDPRLVPSSSCTPLDLSLGSHEPKTFMG